MDYVRIGVVLASLACVSRLTAADPVGLQPLRAEQPLLNGSGVPVIQPEGGGETFEVNPAVVGQPVELFRWISLSGSSTNFPNAVGLESGHAGQVGSILYGIAGGVAPAVAHVDNYDALYFYNSVIVPRSAIAASIVNQSFIFELPEATVNRAYDDFAATYNVLFVSGAGNGGDVMPPASAYNGLAVAAYQGASSIGPTTDGRAKPDLTAPASFTSFSTPAAAGAAVLLMQAGARGDGGGSVEATNVLTLKALLLNGAVKPAGWTNGVARPLDARYGAGLLNIYQSYRHLVGGRHAPIETTSPVLGGAHPPGSSQASVSVARGWDQRALASGLLNDAVAHYYFDLSAGTTYSMVATLVWARQFGQVQINNLDLFLVRVEDGTLLASSQSSVDNVEHLFVQNIPAGRVDLQVLKHGGAGVSLSENYALAFECVAQRLEISQQSAAIVVNWPISSAGFGLEESADLAQWTTATAAVRVTNGMNQVEVAGAPSVFYRLARP